jgi:hypothetical protein
MDTENAVNIGTETTVGHSNPVDGPKGLLITSKTDCWYKTGKDVIAAENTGGFLPANAGISVFLDNGERVSSYGLLNIVPFK